MRSALAPRLLPVWGLSRVPIDRLMTSTALLNRKQAAAYLTVSLSTLDRLSRSGALPLVRFGGVVRFLPSDLDEFLEAHRE